MTIVMVNTIILLTHPTPACQTRHPASKAAGSMAPETYVSGRLRGTYD